MVDASVLLAVCASPILDTCGRLFMPTCILILSSVHHCVLIHVTPTWSARTLAKQGSMRLCAVLYGPFPVAQFATHLFRLHSTLTPLRSFSALRQHTPLAQQSDQSTRAVGKRKLIGNADQLQRR